MAKELIWMDLRVTQVALLGVSCLIAALGVYTLVTNRVPRLRFLPRDPRKPRRYGWGVILIALFGFTGALGQDVMEPGSGPDLALLVLSYVFFVPGIVLVMLSGKRSQ
ncbi:MULTISPECIES: hypothetical protein [Streptosporangium]|uniref:Membrane protein YfcA n=1 Tax=Streptosporangium brasiliense TaxID=47480 RepID=A0ABT9R220_9ACTN|nr:hypothetical protein [Streptosporangium brasiliense]MDP9863277.1 putative membrane protein YfcA [Streptosporangium brasiliense]